MLNVLAIPALVWLLVAPGAPSVKHEIGRRNFRAELRAFRGVLESRRLTLDNFADQIDRTYADFFLADPIDFDLADLQGRGAEVAEEVFATRQLLRDRYREILQSAPSLDDPRVRECARALRQMVRAARFAEDYLIEWDDSLEIAKQKRTSPIEGSRPPRLMFRDSTATGLELRTGDVFVLRSPSSVSAGVARIASIASQFSHAGFIYVDPGSGRRFIVDSQMTDGLRYRPIENLLSGKSVRVAFFRFEDPEIARCAAEKARAEAVEAGRGDEKVFYDFPNDMDDHRRMFCAEVIRAKFEECAREQGKSVASVPMFPSVFGKRNRSLLSAMGIRSERTFQPGDIEVDPRFELCAEWRDFRKLEKNRHLDAILTKVFQWMDEENYQFHVGGSWRFMINRVWNMEANAHKSGPPGSWLTGPIRKPIRRAVALDVRNDDTGLEKEGAGQAIELDRLSRWLDARLRTMEKAHRRETSRSAGFGVPMTYRELLSSLDSLKATKLETRKRFRPPPPAATASVAPSDGHEARRP
ncbi:MAG TPA: YiiX/YebB-like N1pC/P60 family cysteine hydrolase [Candidatus Eisenbacteria bacterium]|jgi:hypothetical protein